MALALGVRIHGIGEENFWVDEVHQFRIASQSVSDVLQNYRPDSKYGTRDQAPLSLVISHFFISDRHTEFWFRLPSSVFGTLGVLALFLVARRLVPVRVALLAALFLALSPLDVWYGQEARWYAQWACVSTFSYLLLMEAREAGSARLWLAYGFAALVNLYTFIYSVFVTVAQGLSVLLSGHGHQKSLKKPLWFLGVHIAVLAACAPVLNVVFSSAGKAYSGTLRPSSLFELPYAAFTYAAGFTFGPTVSKLHDARSPANIVSESPEILLVLLVFTPLVVLGIVRVVRDAGLRNWVLPWLVIPPVLVFVTSAIMTEMTFQVRYTIVAVPAFMLVVAIGTMSFSGWMRRLAGGSVIAIFAISLSNLYWDSQYNKADVRGALGYVWAQDQKHAQLVAVGQIEYVLPHYAMGADTAFVGCGSRSYTDYTLIDPTAEPPGFPEELDLSRTTWVLVGRDWARDREPCLKWLSQNYTIGNKIELTGVELFRLEPLLRPAQGEQLSSQVQ